MPTTEPPEEHNQGEDAGVVGDDGFVDDATILGNDDGDAGGDVGLGSALAAPD